MASQSGKEVSEKEMNGVVQRTSPFQQMLRAMEMDATMDTESGNFSGDDITAILTAETEEEMFKADQRGPLNFQDLAGCEITVTGIQVKFGRGGNDDDKIKTMFVTADGKQMYLMVTMHRISNAGQKIDRILPEIGETFQANTSARFCVAQLWWLSTHGRIDAEAGKAVSLVVQSTELGGGQAVIKLTSLPERAI